MKTYLMILAMLMSGARHGDCLPDITVSQGSETQVAVKNGTVMPAFSPSNENILLQGTTEMKNCSLECPTAPLSVSSLSIALSICIVVVLCIGSFFMGFALKPYFPCRKVNKTDIEDILSDATHYVALEILSSEMGTSKKVTQTNAPAISANAPNSEDVKMGDETQNKEKDTTNSDMRTSGKDTTTINVLSEDASTATQTNAPTPDVEMGEISMDLGTQPNGQTSEISANTTTTIQTDKKDEAEENAISANTPKSQTPSITNSEGAKMEDETNGQTSEISAYTTTKIQTDKKDEAEENAISVPVPAPTAVPAPKAVVLLLSELRSIVNKKISQIKSEDLSVINTVIKLLERFARMPISDVSEKATDEQVKNYPFIWKFDSIKFNENCGGHGLVVFALFTLEKFGFFECKEPETERLKINTTKFVKFIIEIEGGYKKNPYHNSIHAMDVLQFVSCLLDTCTKFLEAISKLELLSILMAAICHDYKHPGVSNQFLIDTKDELAITYNDSSVLEQYHCAETFRLLLEDEFYFFEVESDYVEFRKNMIGLILATDTSHHAATIVELKSRLENGLENKEDRFLLMKLTLMFADISNPTRTWEICQGWAGCVMEENFLQGDMEKKLELPVSANMDRSTTNIPSVQITFLTLFVKPFLELMIKVLPGLSPLADAFKENIVKELNANIAHWAVLRDITSPPETTTTTISTSTATTTSTISAIDSSDSSNSQNQPTLEEMEFQDISYTSILDCSLNQHTHRQPEGVEHDEEL